MVVPQGISKVKMDSSSGFSGIFSVDVEDWYHILDIPSAPAMSEWE